MRLRLRLLSSDLSAAVFFFSTGSSILPTTVGPESFSILVSSLSTLGGSGLVALSLAAALSAAAFSAACAAASFLVISADFWASFSFSASFSALVLAFGFLATASKSTLPRTLTGLAASDSGSAGASADFSSAAGVGSAGASGSMRSTSGCCWLFWKIDRSISTSASSSGAAVLRAEAKVTLSRSTTARLAELTAFSFAAFSSWKLERINAYASASILVFGFASTSMPLLAKKSTMVWMPKLNSRAILFSRTGLLASAIGVFGR